MSFPTDTRASGWACNGIFHSGPSSVPALNHSQSECHDRSAIRLLVAILELIINISLTGQQLCVGARLIAAGLRFISRTWQVIQCITLAICDELDLEPQSGSILHCRNLLHWRPLHCRIPEASDTPEGFLPANDRPGQWAGWGQASGSASAAGIGTNTGASRNGNGRNGPRMTSRNSENPESVHAEEPERRFCCVLHHTEEYAHDVHCATTHRFVAQIKRHHEKHRLYYCIVCLLVFNTLEERERHGRCANFKCVTQACVNRGKHPRDTGLVCTNHARDHNNQEDLYRTLCRLLWRWQGRPITPRMADVLGSDELVDHVADSMELNNPAIASSTSATSQTPSGSRREPLRAHGSAQVAEVPAPAPVTQLCEQIENFARLLRRLEYRKTELDGRADLISRTTSFVVQQCHDEMERRLRETTSRLSADDEPTIANPARTGHQADRQGNASYGTASIAEASTHASFHNAFSSFVQDPGEVEALLPSMGMFPGHIPHRAPAGLPLPQVIFPDATGLASAWEPRGYGSDLDLGDWQQGELDDEN